MDSHRIERVADAIRLEIEEIVNYELSDPRVGGIAVLEVLLSPDGRLARIRVQAEGPPDRQRETLAALLHARGHVRRQLAERLDVFRIPDIQFEPALAPETEARAAHLLRRVRRRRPRPPATAESGTEPGNSPLR